MYDVFANTSVLNIFIVSYGQQLGGFNLQFF